MSGPRIALDRVARLALVSVSLASSLYALLAHVPFTSVHFLGFRHFDALAIFVELHPWVVAAAWLPHVAAALPRLRSRAERSRTSVELAASAGLAIAIALFAPLATVSTRAPLLVAFLWLVPPAVVAGLDLRAAPRDAAGATEATPAAEPGSAIVLSSLLAAVVVSLFFVARGTTLDGGLAAVLAASVAAHAVVVLVVALLFALADGVGVLFEASARARLVLAALPLVIVVERGLRLGALASISFFGAAAAAYAAAFAVVLAASLAAAAWRTADDGRPLRRLVAPIAPAGPVKAALALAGVALAAHFAIVSIERIDWNDLGRRIVVMLAWAVTFAVVHRGRPVAAPRERGLVYLAALAPLALHLGLGATFSEESARALERHTPRDPSYATAASLLRPRDAGSAFYAFLKRHTNLPRETPIASPEIRLVADLGSPRTEPPPHVFVVVVDSLRQDYLGAYEPRVDFTPAIDAFARDAVVFENAFTRYGATGLSEPSIWTGALLPHLQYPQPFAPLNALARLLEHEGYDVHASLDTILAAILPPELEVTDVDAERSEKDFDLCRSLDSIASAVARPPARPIFFYTQPQDLHVSVRRRQGDRVVDDGTYEGFHAPYASRVRRLDGCFGRFLDELRRAGLYDRSVVVLTSDHGDSLGEEGRWGHAYTLAPEVVRIPMIVRLPPQLRDRFAVDRQAVAFSIDLTPSLHRLLGHGPIRDDPRFGSALFRPRDEPVDPRRKRDAHLLASSYGPVWGLLSADGHELYVADAVAFEDTRHDLSRAFAGERLPIGAAERGARRERMRREILAVEQGYGITIEARRPPR